MKILDWIKIKKQEEKIDLALNAFEEVLDNNLIRLEPNPRFVINLRQKLLQQITKVDVQTSPAHQKLQKGLIVTGGIIGGALVFITSIRGFISIIGLTNLLLNRYRDNVGGSLSTTEMVN